MIFRGPRPPHPRGLVPFYHTSKARLLGAPVRGAELGVRTAEGAYHRRDKRRADVTGEKKGARSSRPAGELAGPAALGLARAGRQRAAL